MTLYVVNEQDNLFFFIAVAIFFGHQFGFAFSDGL